MKENFRKNYFLLLRIIVAALFEIYLLVTTKILNKEGYIVLLAAACFFTTVVLYGLWDTKKVFLLLEIVTAGILCSTTEQSFILLFGIVFLDIVQIYSLGMFGYVLPLGISFFIGTKNIGQNFLFLILVSLLYFQHNEIVLSYRKQMKEEENLEMSLKRDIKQKEDSYQKNIYNNILRTENALLEERARLSQILHDKLGHNINGTIYQLEACKVLLEKDTTRVEKSN